MLPANIASVVGIVALLGGVLAVVDGPPPDVDRNKLLITAVSVVEQPELTYDPITKVGKQSGDWTFAGVVCRGAGWSGSGDSDCWSEKGGALAKSLRTALSELAPKANSGGVGHDYWGISGLQPILNVWQEGSALGAFPARLCAIVNRFDRAEVTSANVVDGAEIRFEYELLGASPQENNTEAAVSSGGVVARQPHAIVEVEFARVDAEEFHRLATDWFSSGELDPLRLNRLTRCILAWPVRELRLRILSPGTNGVWHLAQLRLGPGRTSFVPFDIAEQAAFSQGEKIGTPIVYVNQPGLADFISKARDKIASGRFAVPRPYRVPRVRFIIGSTVACSPWICEENRHVFALNQCVGCHSGETETNFLHIGDRLPGEASAVSAFFSSTDVTIDHKGCLAGSRVTYSYAEAERRQAAVKELLALTKTFQPKAVKSYNERRALFRSVH